MHLDQTTIKRAILAVSVLISITWIGVHISLNEHGSHILPRLQKLGRVDLEGNLSRPLIPVLIGPNVIFNNMPYWKWLPETEVDSRKRYPKASLTVHPTLVENGGIVTLKWTNIPPHKHSPWMGLYCPADSAPNSLIDYWSIRGLSPLPDRGQVNVTLFNIREECQFRFYLNDSYTELVAKSRTVQFIGGRGAPIHGHIALTGDPDEMRVMWTSGIKSPPPMVHYGLCNGELSFSASGTSTTYTAADMCGPPANQSTYFKDPGYLHNVLLTGLKPNTIYCYQFGNQASNQFSSVKMLRTALPAGLDHPYQFIVYGDMDLTRAPGAEATCANVYKDVQSKDTAFVLHVGDLGYAVGFAYRWDEFMTRIEPIATRTPYMIAIGNHEQNTMVGGSKDPSGVTGNGFHPSWGNYGHDSGGECGVPVYHRFHMPDNGNKLWWYSFKYGVVHFIQISTEHNFTRGSKQYSWLEQELKSVDRKLTPWLVVSMHRPMYTIDKYYSDGIICQHLRSELEDLFYLHHVDLVLSGHYHSYERTCKVYRQRCVEDGIVHMVIGSGGYPITKTGTVDATWSRHFEYTYGYVRMEVANKTALYWEFVRNKNRVVGDSFWLYK